MEELKRIINNTVVVVCVAFLVSQAAAQSERPMGPPLVKLDSDYTTLLAEARKLVVLEEYVDAIELYQGLIERGGDNVFQSEPGIYLSISEGARRGVADLPAPGRKMYLSFYESVAQKEVNDAMAMNDPAAMMRLASQYPITQASSRALYLAGVYYFDQGRYDLAIRCWKRALERGSKDQFNSEIARARLAVAYLRSGRSDDLKELVKELETAGNAAKIKLAGSDTEILTFVKDVMAKSVPKVARGDDHGADWSTPAGNAAGNRLMNDADFVLNPQWLYIFQDDKTRVGSNYGNFPAQIRSQRQQMNMDPDFVAAPRPLILGDRVYVRSWDAIHCINAYTGKLALQQQPALLELQPRPQMMLFDNSRWNMTAYRGRLFELENFPAYPPNLPANVSRSNNLVARDLDTLNVRWQIGNGKGTDEWLNKALFVTAPVAAEGRLYLLAIMFESYYLVCLDADTGELIWKSHVSSMPSGALSTASMMGAALPPSASPSIFGDTVVCGTNGGVIAAFERVTGDVKWVLQYPSAFNPPGAQLARGRGVVGKIYPLNPIVIVDSIVYTLPSDTDEMYAISLDNGEFVWRADRGNRNYLAGLSDGKVVLCGPDIVGIGMKTGKTEWTPPINASLIGRPALTEKYLYVCQTEHGIIRVELGTGASTLFPLMRKEGLLGDLLMVGDKLVVSTSKGVAGYLSYESAYKYASDQIRGGEADALPALYRQRGVVSFVGQRFERAVEDFQKALTMAQERKVENEVQNNQIQLYGAYVSWGLTQPLNQLESYLDKAAAQVKALPPNSPSSIALRSELAFLYAKCHEALGNLPQSIAALQDVLDNLPETVVELPDLIIEGARIIRGLNRSSSLNGYYARQEMGRLIKQHGAVIYAAQDAKAKQIRQQALTAKDTSQLRQVANKYPFSSVADRALQDAAEIHFAANSYKEAQDALSLWLRRYPSRNAPAGALAGLTLVYERENRPLLAKSTLRRLAAQPADQKIEFASYNGSIGDFIKTSAGRIGVDVTKLKARWVDLPMDLKVPIGRVAGLQRVYGNFGRQLLTDEDGTAVTFNDMILTLEPPPMSQLAALDPRTLEPVWKALADFNQQAFMMRQPNMQMQLIAHVFEDVLTVADREKIVGIDARSGKRSWVYSIGQPTQVASSIYGAGQIFVVDARANVTALDPVTGKRLWENAARTVTGLLQVEPGSEYVAVISPSDGGARMFQNRGGRVADNRVIWIQQPAPVPGMNGASYYISCLTSSSGKLASEIRIDIAEELSVRMTESDQLLVLGSTFLRCYSPATGLAMWEAAFKDATPRILANNDEVVVVALDTAAKSEIVAFSMESGKILWRAPMDDKGRRLVPLVAMFQGDQVLVGSAFQLANMNFAMLRMGKNRRGITNNNINQIMGPRLSAISLADGTIKWTNKLATNLDDNSWIWLDLPLATETQAIFVARRSQPAQRLVAFILDTTSGLPLQEVMIEDTTPVAGRQQINYQALQSCGMTVITNGVMVIEAVSELQSFDKAGAAQP